MPTKQIAKKAVKKSVKKAMKKVAKKRGKHTPGHELRRAYEHLGRLEAVQGGLPVAVITQIDALTSMARSNLEGGNTRSAADLLRACEHLAFAAIGSGSRETSIGDDLQEAIDTEYESLIERAAEHWDEQDPEPPEAFARIYEATFAAAEAAYAKGAFRRALELARGAEAMSHGEVSFARLGAGKRAVRKQLKG